LQDTKRGYYYNLTSKFRIPKSQQLAEKVIFLRLLKNAQMQGPRNPEE
jgi:hypothetical protein